MSRARWFHPIAYLCTAALGFGLGASTVKRTHVTLPERPSAAAAEQPQGEGSNSATPVPGGAVARAPGTSAPAPAVGRPSASALAPDQKIEAVQRQLDALSPRARSGDWGQAYAAILSLADEPSGAVETQLYEWAQSGNRMWMFAAAAALERRGDARESERIAEQVGQQIAPQYDEERRFRAANDLSRLRSPKALPYLSEAARDPSPAVRLVVAQALAYVRDDGVVPIARTLLTDSSDPVRKAAQDALGRAGAR